MTRQQLDLLVEYINLKARVTAREAVHQPASKDSHDRLAELIGELEETIEEQP